MTVTPRFALPLLATAQAQKEVTHNEALALIDALIQPLVEGGPHTVPPAAPDEGQCWLVGAGASGAWSGRDEAIAIWTEGGWRFVAPRDGMRVFRLDDGRWLRRATGSWVEAATLAGASGGGIVDAEARSTLAALILILEAHGLLISG